MTARTAPRTRTRTDIRSRSRIRAPRPGFAASAAALLAAALCLLLPAGAAHADTTAPTASPGPLVSPDNDDAMLNLLMENGIQYTTSTDPFDAASYGGDDSTLVIDGDETGLSSSELTELANAGWGRVIILGGDADVIDAFAPGVRPVDQADAPGGTSTPVPPECDQPDASAAGPVLMPSGSEVYRLPAATPSATAGNGTSGDAGDGTDPAATSTAESQLDDATGCYPLGSPSAPALVSVQDPRTGGDVILLGFTDFVANQYLAQQGDAALALRLFGAHGTLVWLATQFTEDENLNGCQGSACADGGGGNPGGGGGGAGGGGGSGGGGSGSGGSSQAVTLAQLMPHWIWWMLLQLVLAAIALAYWRSRRLGRLVGEQLPVRVRAAETVEGHANLYRRASAHGRAAGLLRSAAARRIAPLLGLPAGPAGRVPSSLVGPVAERLGRAPEQVRAILAGAAPMTEAELVQLTDQLDRLEQEVRSP